MSAGLLPAIIDRLSRQYPRLVFTVRQAATIPMLYADLRERRVDFIFGRMMAPVDHEDMSAEVLFADPLIIVAGSRSKWLRRRKIDPAELVDEPWCLPPDDLPITPFVVEAFLSRGLKAPHIAVRSNSPHLLYGMVRTGRFLAVAPSSTVQLSGARLGLKPLPMKFAIKPGPVGIVTLKNCTISPVAQRFIECARKFVTSIANGTRTFVRVLTLLAAAAGTKRPWPATGKSAPLRKPTSLDRQATQFSQQHVIRAGPDLASSVAVSSGKDPAESPGMPLEGPLYHFRASY